MLNKLHLLKSRVRQPVARVRLTGNDFYPITLLNAMMRTMTDYDVLCVCDTIMMIHGLLKEIVHNQ